MAVDHLIADSATAQKPLASAASLEFRLDVAKDLPDVWGDRERLHQVLENLIGNAVKSQSPEVVSPWVFRKRTAQSCSG